MAETDILLTLGLDTKDAYKDAEHLQKEIEDIFKNRKGTQSASLTSIEIQMKKLSQQSKELRTSMQEMLDIHADYSEITSQFSSLSSTLDELEKKMIDPSVHLNPEEMEQLENEIDKIYNDMAALIPQMKELEQLQVPTKEFADLEKEYARLDTKLGKLKVDTAAYNKVADELDEVERKMNQMRASGTAMIDPRSTEEFQKYQTKLDSVNDKMKQLIIKHREATLSGEKTVKTFSRLGGVLNTLRIAITKVANGAKRLFSHFLALKKTTSGPANPFKSLLRSLLRFGLGMASIYMLVNKLRSAVREGFSNLVKDNKTFKKSVDSLKGSLTTFKNSIAAAFQPIASLAIPYIQKLVDWMSALMQQVAKFSAAITGQKYYMRAIKQTGDAAEKAQKQLAGFDKLNVLNSENGAGGTMFEEVPLEDAETLLQQIKDFFSLEGLYDLGKTFAEKINEFLTNIPWDDIKKKAAEIGQKLATLLNGWVDNLDWEQVGHTIAEGFNTLFNFLYNFVDTLHWREIGEGIGKAITTFFTDTDFDLIANTIAGYINGLGETIAGFLQETDFKLIGDKIGGFLDELITGGDDGIGGIDFELIGQNLYHAIVGLADIVVHTMTSIDWEEVGNKIADCLKEIFDPNKDPNVFEAVGKVLWECLKAAVELNKGIWEDNPVAGIIIDGIVLAITVSSVTPIVTSLASMFGVAATTGTGAAALAGVCNPIGLTIAALIAVGIGGYCLGEKLGEVLFSEGNPFSNDDVNRFKGIGRDVTNIIEDGMKEKTDLLNNLLDSQSTQEGKDALNKYIEGLFNGTSRDTLYSIGQKIDWNAIFNIPGMKLAQENLAWVNGKIVTKAELARQQMELLGIAAKDTGDAFAYEGPRILTFEEALQQMVTPYSELQDRLDRVGDTYLATGGLIIDENAIIAESMYDMIDSTGATFNGTLQNFVHIGTESTQVFKDMESSMAESSSGMVSIFSSLAGNLKTAFNSIIGGSEGMANGVADGINEVTDSLNTFNFTLPDWLPNIGGKSLDFKIPRISKISIPKLAQGAVIPANKEFLAVLGDQKQGTNVEAPLDTIKQALAEVMMQMGGSSDNSDIVINIDGDEVFRIIRDKDRVFKKSTGKSAFA